MMSVERGWRTLKKIRCYSAGPGLFCRDLPDGGRETWAEAQARIQKQDEIISSNPRFEVITPSNEGFEDYPEHRQSEACMLSCLLQSVRADIVFADVTPFGGREPDSGTVVEAVTCALAGGLLVLWSDPLTTLAERYQDYNVHPDSSMDKHYNLMLEQLYKCSWRAHFGYSRDVFEGLESAVKYVTKQIGSRNLEPVSLLERLNSTEHESIIEAVHTLLYVE